MNILKSIFVWVLVTLMLAILFIPALIIWLLTVLFDKRLRILHQYSCFWASTYTWLSPFWFVTVYNKEKIKPGKVYILVSNHQSMLDIIVLYRLFVHFKWVAKKELFRIPFVGWNMTLNRYIALRRGRASSILSMIKDSKKTLEQGSSLMIFPEGTRSLDTKLKQFKDGAFKLALETQTPIIPIVLNGTGTALPKKGLIFKGIHRITVHILDEIPVSEFQNKDIRSLTAMVHEIMDKELELIKTRV